MASLSAEAAEDDLKRSLHWISDEVDRLGVCWCNVSTEKGGVGSSQRLEGMWKKITIKYHTDTPPPPVPVDSRGNFCLPRNEASLSSKWKRTRPLIAKYMKCHMIAINNPQSGEDAEGVLKRAMKLYKQTKSANFQFLSTYQLIKDQPKWRLDVAQLRETVEQQTGAAQQTVRERLAREAAKEPTVIGTDKPEGQKKARRTMAEVSAKDKEIAEKEAALKSYLDALTEKKQLGITVLMEGSKRTRAMQEAVDDDLMRTDTTAMDAATRGFFELRKKHALENLMEVDEERTRVRLAKAQAIAARTTATPATASNTEPATATPATASNTDPATATEVERVVQNLESDEEGDGVDVREFPEGYNGSEEEFDARVRDEE